MGRHGDPQGRFWEKVDRAGECWVWQASRPRGLYGHFWLDGRMRLAHRVSYEWELGPVPVGMTLDHTCGETGCVRPSHMEVVSMRENILRGNGWAARNARKTHCPRGHRLSGTNLLVRTDGARVCRICRRRVERQRDARARFRRNGAAW